MILEKYRYFQLKKRNYCIDINQYSQSDRDLESTKQIHKGYDKESTKNKKVFL